MKDETRQTEIQIHILQKSSIVSYPSERQNSFIVAIHNISDKYRRQYENINVRVDRLFLDVKGP